MTSQPDISWQLTDSIMLFMLIKVGQWECNITCHTLPAMSKWHNMSVRMTWQTLHAMSKWHITDYMSCLNNMTCRTLHVMSKWHDMSHISCYV